MIDVVCSHGPMAVGETRVLHVSGDGPFTLKVGNFVTDPPPLGLHEHSTQTVESSFELKADEEFWSTRKGGLQIDITDAKGAKRRLHFNIQPALKGLVGSVKRA